MALVSTNVWPRLATDLPAVQSRAIAMTDRIANRAADLRFIRSDVRAITGYTPGEQPRGGSVIKLNTNENPYPPSPKVLAAMATAAAEDIRLYPDPLATELRERAAELYGLDPDQVLAGNGYDEILMIILRACIDAGATVAYPVPTYSLYDTLVKICGGCCATVPFPGDFTLPLDELVALRARVTFLCNPNAPSGTTTRLAVVRELASRVDGLLVVDEAYGDFGSVAALDLIAEFPNVVVTRSFSKSFSLAGLRVGLVLGQSSVIAEFFKVKDSYNLNRVSIAAAVAALADSEWMRTNVERIRRTRQRLHAGLTDLGYQVLPSETNFVLARRPGEDQRTVYESLRSHGILVRYFATPELRDALRITVGTDDEIEALLAALAEITAS